MGNPLAHASADGRPRRPRLRSGSLCAGPTYASHFSVVAQSGGQGLQKTARRGTVHLFAVRPYCEFSLATATVPRLKRNRSQSGLTH